MNFEETNRMNKILQDSSMIFGKYNLIIIKNKAIGSEY